MYETIIYEVKDQIAYITINRPKALNALNEQLVTELNETFEAIDTDAIRCVILTGGGIKSAACLHFIGC